LIQPITIPKTSDLDSLVQTLNFKLGSLVASINSERPSTDQSLNGHRLINVGSPSRPTDAVTVDYLDRQLKDLHQRLKTSTIHYVNAQLGAPPTSSEGVLADIPSTLTAEDAGYLYYATTSTRTNGMGAGGSMRVGIELVGRWPRSSRTLVLGGHCVMGQVSRAPSAMPPQPPSPPQTYGDYT
jgi:hypothetical protein